MKFKAMSAVYRLHSCLLFFIGALMDIGLLFGVPFLEHASAMSLWIYGTVLIAVLVFGAIAWVRFVPAAVSLTLATIAWGAFGWIVLRRTHVL
jgi:hypothetical protein